MMRGLVPLLFATTLAALGCGTSPGTLTGRVTTKGVPLTQGRVTAIDSAGKMASGEIQPDGSYRIENCPGGEVKLWVHSPDPVETARVIADKKASGRFPPDSPELVQPKGNPETWRPIREEYASPETSGLIVSVRGDTEYNILLD